jgi:hypothetical protein
LFGSELERQAFLQHPDTLPPTFISERSVMLDAVWRMTAPYRTAGQLPTWQPTAQNINEIARVHAEDLRLIGRQLIVLKNMEGYLAGRTDTSAAEAPGMAYQSPDLYGKITRFLQTHHPKENEGPGTTVYDLLRKEGIVASTTDANQDYAMGVVLRRTGMGRPASNAYPRPLRGLIVTPTDRGTYRLAYRRKGSQDFGRGAQDVEVITTERYPGLISDQDKKRVIVTGPDYLQQAIRSGQMHTKFDLILTDGFSAKDREEIQDMIHAQRVGPVIIHFVVGSAKVTPSERIITEDAAGDTA